MPDEETNAHLTRFDTEPPTGHHDTSETSEHADLHHRLEVDAADERQHAHTQPVATPAAPSYTPPLQPAEPPVSGNSNEVGMSELPNPGPGLMVLQWLVYAFWGWTVLSLSGLILLVVNTLLHGSDDSESWYGGGIAYLLAAVIVLFIISLSCDLFYAKAERKHARSNGTNVIMIIHAVLFSLFGIGALIMAVFGGVKLLIGDTEDTPGTFATIISGAVIFLIYGATLLRTLRPRWLKGIASLYWVFMTVVIIVTVILGVVGPVAQARLQAQDRAVESGLPDVVSSINSYANTSQALPKSLSQLSNLSGDAKKIVDDNALTYTPKEEIKPITSRMYINQGISADDNFAPNKKVFHYQLCTTYKSDKNSSYSDDNYRTTDQSYPTTVSAYYHAKGNVCYDLQTDYSY